MHALINWQPIHGLQQLTARFQQVNAGGKPVGEFSGVAYAFGQELLSEIGVPIGLIQSDWGGTQIEAWMPEARLREFSGFEDTFRFIENARDPARRAEVLRDAQGTWWEQIDRFGSSPVGEGWQNVGFDVR